MNKSIAILVICLLVPAVHAASPNFLYDVTPISDFTKEDSDMFWDAVTSALSLKKDGEKLAWKNDKSGNSGLVNPLSTYQENNTQCRNLRFINRSKRHIAENTYKFCHRDGKWVAIELVK